MSLIIDVRHLVLKKIPNLLQPFSGAISDRMNRKQILLFCDFTRGLLIGIMGLLSIFNALSVELIYITALLMNILSQF
ncbi:MFS transporter [Clostridium peptidivorans]|uniref:MFS transporter n=1 Tax=Clostridium peptidivorans TaxID=100174 RepID=UPI00117817F2|nr:MFS transporter [Clostridium peptidivorans]